MKIPGTKSAHFHRGLGAEYAFRTEAGLALVSGGHTLRIQIEPLETGEGHRLVLRGADGDVVLASGSARDVYARLSEIDRQCMSPSKVGVSRKGAYAVLAAFTAVYLVFCHPAAMRPVGMAAPGGASGPAGMEQIIERLQKAAEAPDASSANPSPAPQAAPQLSAPVVDKPDFLALPEETSPAPAGPEASPATKTPDVVKPAALPAYTPDLYKQKTAPEAPKADPEPKPVAETAKPVAPAAATTEPATAVPPAALPKEAEKVSAVSPEAPSAVPAGTQAGKADPAAAKAVEGAMKSGMDQKDALETLKQLQALTKMDPSDITPEMLSKLPHEIAQQLKDTGVLANPAAMPETGDAPYKAIRLPEQVFEKYRGKDGIASIPENDTYAALGNRILLQLPGGGDIRKPEDLEGFGFKP